MATTADAELILKLYDLRREELLRKARVFLFEMPAKTTDDILKVQRGVGTPENAMWRQAISYWEMAASFVLHGAVDADLFLDTSGEGIFYYTKFHRLYKEATGVQFMPKTAVLIAQYTVADEDDQRVHMRLAAEADNPVAKADQAFNRG